VWTTPRKLGIAAFITLLALAASASGHELGLTRTTVVFLDDGTLRVEMLVDLDALALGMPQNTDNTELMGLLEALPPEDLEAAVERLRQTFLRRVRVRVDGETFLPDVSFPDRGSTAAREAQSVLGLRARLSGSIPVGATAISLQASRAFPPLHISYVDLRNRRVSGDRLDEMLGDVEPLATEYSEELTADDVAMDSDPLANFVTLRQIVERGDRSEPYPLDRPPPVPTRMEVVGQYLGLGFEHILPLGIDHILFVLGLFLLNTAWRPLLAQVTAFTVAHTLTLGLATYDVISLSPAIVEPLIAVSIAWIAFENVITQELKPWRPVIVFGFGLLHGLGFAGVLSELGLPRGEYLTALLSFNAGVELGQLAVIAIALLTIGWFRDRPWYRTRVTVPLSVMIGVVGLYWAIQRTFWG